MTGDHSIKLSISYALSQSTKLCVFEERVLEIVASTKDLPESLASTGIFHLHLKSMLLGLALMLLLAFLPAFILISQSDKYVGVAGN